MPFTAQHVTHAQVIHLSAPPEAAFPLFEPIGEQAWDDDWKPNMLFPTDGAARPDTVFTVRHAALGESIWTLPVYEPASFRLTYVQVLPGSRVGRIDIRCQHAPDGGTHAAVRYTFTGLSEQGNAFVATFTEAFYQEMMAAWERAINYFLAHGHALPHH